MLYIRHTSNSNKQHTYTSHDYRICLKNQIGKTSLVIRLFVNCFIHSTEIYRIRMLKQNTILSAKRQIRRMSISAVGFRYKTSLHIVTPCLHNAVSNRSNILARQKKIMPSTNSIMIKRFYSEKCTTSTNGVDVPKEIVDLPLNTYHNEADKILDSIFEQLEILSEDYPDLIPEVELEHGVMTLNLAKLGPYVINKQPPNKQIWFASPVSGPNRFDFYQNEWISLRNNIKLIDLINEELRMAMPGHDVTITKAVEH